MSTNFIHLIPTDPVWQPTQDAAAAAAAQLRTFVPQALNVEAKFTAETEFFYPMGYWEGVTCPSCHKDVEDWFYKTADRASKANFRDLMAVTPCCGATVSLNDLRYIAPAGFGRFVLQAQDANIRDLPVPQVSALSDLLGHDLRQILVHV